MKLKKGISLVSFPITLLGMVSYASASVVDSDNLTIEGKVTEFCWVTSPENSGGTLNMTRASEGRISTDDGVNNWAHVKVENNAPGYYRLTATAPETWTTPTTAPSFTSISTYLQSNGGANNITAEVENPNRTQTHDLAHSGIDIVYVSVAARTDGPIPQGTYSIAVVVTCAPK